MDLTTGEGLRQAAQRVMGMVEMNGKDVVVGAAGDGTADAVAHAVAMLMPCPWATIRLRDKDHGTGSGIEGTRIEKGTPVLVIVLETWDGYEYGDLERTIQVLDEVGANWHVVRLS